MRKAAVWYATFFGIGYIWPAPGTWASLVTTVILFFAAPHITQPAVWIAAAVLLYIAGVPAARRCAEHFQKEDPRHCVIDEVVGQIIALLLLPRTIGFYLAGFLLFRFFDILKPPPVRQSERLPHGFGIMSDDVLAGLYAFLVLRLYLYFIH